MAKKPMWKAESDVAEWNKHNCVAVELTYSSDDGGWYGNVVRMSPGEQPQTHLTDVFPTRAKASKAAYAYAMKVWPGVRQVELSDC